MGASQISPLRTPRDLDWPGPTTFSTPSAFISPTTAQTLEVPISNPTMMLEESNISFPGALGFQVFGSRRRHRPGVDVPQRSVLGNREIERGDAFVQTRALLVD